MECDGAVRDQTVGKSDKVFSANPNPRLETSSLLTSFTLCRMARLKPTLRYGASFCQILPDWFIRANTLLLSPQCCAKSSEEHPYAVHMEF